MNKRSIIKSSGFNGQGTDIVDQNTGAKLSDVAPVKSITVKFGVDEVVTATVEVIVEKVEIEPGEVRYVSWHPEWGVPELVKSIEFKDGSKYSFDNKNNWMPEVEVGQVDITRLTSTARSFVPTVAKSE